MKTKTGTHTHRTTIGRLNPKPLWRTVQINVRPGRPGRAPRSSIGRGARAHTHSHSHRQIAVNRNSSHTTLKQPSAGSSSAPPTPRVVRVRVHGASSRQRRLARAAHGRDNDDVFFFTLYPASASASSGSWCSRRGTGRPASDHIPVVDGQWKIEIRVRCKIQSYVETICGALNPPISNVYDGIFNLCDFHIMVTNRLLYYFLIILSG